MGDSVVYLLYQKPQSQRNSLANQGQNRITDLGVPFGKASWRTGIRSLEERYAQVRLPGKSNMAKLLHPNLNLCSLELAQYPPPISLNRRREPSAGDVSPVGSQESEFLSH